MDIKLESTMPCGLKLRASETTSFPNTNHPTVLLENDPMGIADTLYEHSDEKVQNEMQTQSLLFNLLTNWGRYKMAAIFETTFSNAFSWMKMFELRLKFHIICSQGPN